jgi:hypothetical protein
MFHGLSIGVIDSSKGRGADNIEVSVSVDGIATAFYTPLSAELNKPPVITDVTISADGPYAEDTTLTATVTGYVNGPFSEGTHVYQWYRLSSTAGGTLTAISGATNSTHTLVAGDIGSYIVVRARYAQSAGGNYLSEWKYSEPTVAIAAGTGGDIVFAWEDYFNFVTGESIPSGYNDVGTDSEVVNLGSGENWTVTAATKPVFDVDKLVFDKALGNKVLRPNTGGSVTHPLKEEVWIDFRYTEVGGNLLSFGSNALLGMNSSSNFTSAGLTPQTGDLNDHVVRIVRNGASSIYQIDGGSEVTFTDSATFASFMLFGTNYTGGAPVSAYLRRFWRTPYNTFLTNTQRDDRWTYLGY